MNEYFKKKHYEEGEGYFKSVFYAIKHEIKDLISDFKRPWER